MPAGRLATQGAAGHPNLRSETLEHKRQVMADPRTSLAGKRRGVVSKRASISWSRCSDGRCRPKHCLGNVPGRVVPKPRPDKSTMRARTASFCGVFPIRNEPFQHSTVTGRHGEPCFHPAMQSDLPRSGTRQTADAFATVALRRSRPMPNFQG